LSAGVLEVAVDQAEGALLRLLGLQEGPVVVAHTLIVYLKHLI
jgi:hypothetical protein